MHTHRDTRAHKYLNIHANTNAQTNYHLTIYSSGGLKCISVEWMLWSPSRKKKIMVDCLKNGRERIENRNKRRRKNENKSDMHLQSNK